MHLPQKKFDLPDETKRGAFLASEFNALRREIELQIVERRKIETQTFIGLAAIYAWLLTRNPPLDPIYMKITLVIPMVFSILGLLRWLGIMMRTMALGAYIQRMEADAAGQGLGWETSLMQLRKRRPLRGQLEGWVEATTWGLTVIGSTGAFIYGIAYL